MAAIAATLVERFGPDMPLPTVLNKLADCLRRRSASGLCGVAYSGPLG